MFEQLQGLLLNVLFIVVFVLFVPLFIDTNLKALSKKHKQLVMIVSFSVAIICNMLFRIEIGESLYLDLRFIPLIVGALYLGRYAALTLVGVLLASRLFIGLDQGFYWTSIVGIIVLLTLIRLYPIFLKLSKKNRIIIGTTTALFVSALVQSVVFFIFKTPINVDFFVIYTLFYVGSALFVFFFAELIRETMYVNNQVIKAKKMEIVSHLASSISHEVRNPLAVVSGFLQMMREMDIPIEKRRQFIDISLQEIERANDIIKNYLTFAKPAPEQYEVMDIKHELQRAIEIIIPLANMNCVEVHTDISSFYLKGQPQLLQQCLLNITKNCVEAMPNGGTLSIQTKQKRDSLLIRIKDSGLGMSKEQLSRLGEPYFTTKGREGTGLGMMTVIQIIEMFNGKLKVDSALTKGTVFELTFPMLKT